MKAPTILVVEDNPASRKLVRVTLESEGYSVLEAPDARTALALFESATPDLVLQDLLLPDMDGFELVRRLRALPGGAEAPIVALSGFLSRLEEAQVPATAFSDFLSKPVEPARLVETVRAHFPGQLPDPDDVREGVHVLAADDDPIQLKLMRIRLGLAGFRVSCASDGQEALELARREPPAAVLSDVVMPRLDGFRLCLALRNEPHLARVPVVLVSASFLDEADQRLAQDVGANALIPRKGDFEEAIAALRASFTAEPPRPTESPGRLEGEHVDHVVRRLEREVAANRRLANRCATQAAALSVLSGIAETLAKTQDVRAVLSEVLARCVDAGGLSLGALYLVDPGGGFRLEAHQGYAEALTARLRAAFGHASLLQDVLAKGIPVVIPSPQVSDQVRDDFLKEAGATSAVVVPIVSHEERLGLLLLASRARALEEGDWIAFARTVAAQVGQAVALAKAVAGIAASESRYRTLMENASDAITIFDSGGRFVELNHQAEKLLGQTRAELVGRDSFEFVVPDERQTAAANLARLAQEGTVYTENRHMLRADGSCVPIDMSSSLVDVGGERLVLTIARDITERQRAETALRSSEKRYRNLFDRNLAGVFRTTTDGRLLECNEAFARIFGHSSREDILSRGAVALYPTAAARGAFLERLEAQGVVVNQELEGRRKDGQPVWLLVNAHLVTAEEPLAGRIVEGTLIDITARRQLEEQLRQSQKMNAIGQLAGGIAHDFNNILAVIGGYAEIALRALPASDPQHRRIDQIRKAAERAAVLTRQLLTFSRKEIVAPTLLDLNDVVRNMEGMLERLIREDIQLVTALAPQPLLIEADRSQVEQVILNLAVNARDAMPDGGRLLVETGLPGSDDPTGRAAQGVSPGGQVLLVVSDTGSGMDAETRSHVFEPFFTTKEPGRGTGLGLATVFGIVEQAGGRIELESEVGRGTTFRIWLPKAQPSARPARAAAVAGEAPKGSETILLVEDEAALRTLARELLESYGYAVIDAGDGLQALALAEQHDGPIHLLMTDLVMPRMGGRDLAERLGAVRPDSRVLYTSGYSDDAVVRAAILEAGAAFVQKPFSPEALARKVREALAAPSRATTRG